MLPLTFDPMESLPRTGVFSVSRRSALADCLFLSLILSVSALPYLGRLGFYSDDWILLAQFVHSRDQSLLGLFTEAYGGNEASRPVYVLLLSTLYRSFGLQPLGYHLINFAFLIAAVCLCYLVLRELGVNAIDVVHSGGSGNNGGSYTNPLRLEGPPNESSW